MYFKMRISLRHVPLNPMRLFTAAGSEVWESFGKAVVLLGFLITSTDNILTSCKAAELSSSNMSLQTHFSTTSNQILRHHIFIHTQDLRVGCPIQGADFWTPACVQKLLLLWVWDPVLPQVWANYEKEAYKLFKWQKSVSIINNHC